MPALLGVSNFMGIACLAVSSKNAIKISKKELAWTLNQADAEEARGGGGVYGSDEKTAFQMHANVSRPDRTSSCYLLTLDKIWPAPGAVPVTFAFLQPVSPLRLPYYMLYVHYLHMNHL
jgi:hypothetical protein